MAMAKQPQKHPSYSLTTKLKAVELAETVCKESASRQFNVDSKRIREWCKQKEAFLAIKKWRGRVLVPDKNWMELDKK